MSRIFVAQGVGHNDRPTASPIANDPDQWRKWPYVLLWNAASGNIAQLTPPSGAGTADQFIVGHARKLHAFPHNCSHKPIAWKNNKLLTFWRDNLNNVNSDFTFSWHPYQQTDGIIVNGVNAQFDTNTDFNSHLVFDGRNYELAGFRITNIGGFQCINTADSIFWCKQINEPGYIYGMIRGHFDSNGRPFVVNPTVPESYFPNLGNYGSPGILDTVKFETYQGATAGGFSSIQGGIDFKQTNASVGMPTDITLSPCDMIEFKGSWYVATQTAIWVTRPGTKGSFIVNEYWDNRQDEFGGDSALGLNDVDINRNISSKGSNEGMRSFVIHKDKLYVLVNTGKLFQVRPQGLISISDIKQVGTHFASGIVGGSYDITPLVAAGGFPAPQAFRPFCASFDNKIHAFLNYELTSTQLRNATGEGIAKASDSSNNGKGVCWFVSEDDGFTWTDLTSSLPTSGILTPSGNIVNFGNWLQITSPYKFSGRFGPAVYPSSYGPQNVNELNHLGQIAPGPKGDDVFPSGFRQATGRPIEAGGKEDRIPYWASGMLEDAAGTPFNSLSPALDKAVISGFMGPTLINYPSGFAYVETPGLSGVLNEGTFNPLNTTTFEFTIGTPPPLGSGVWRAVAQGSKGWDFTGVRNRHIAGYVDYDTEPSNPKLRLYFSDNTPGSVGGALDSAQSATSFYDLNRSFQWIQKNYVHIAGQMAGYIPTDLYDPEIIIPSGSAADVNPKIDPFNKTAKIKFHILDWGKWSQCNVKLSYSIDGGQNWNDATVSGQVSSLSTGTPVTDPSGLGFDTNQFHEIHWLYGDDIRTGEFLPNVRLRMRAESIS
ncbi:MAG: hypothetical protein ACXAC6_19600 [Candidatus Hodarchaeales archaeon]|jgi:hypothetical protein